MPYSHGTPLHNLHVAVTPSDTAILPKGVVAVVVNGTVDDVVLEDEAGTAVPYAAATITAWQQVIPGAWKRVRATGTDATGIVAWVHNPVTRHPTA